MSSFELPNYEWEDGHRLSHLQLHCPKAEGRPGRTLDPDSQEGKGALSQGRIDCPICERELLESEALPHDSR